VTWHSVLVGLSVGVHYVCYPQGGFQQGAHTTHATKDCRRYKKDRTVKADFCAAKKVGKKPNPKQPFAQLSKKLDKSEKTLEKASLKSKKRRSDNSNLDSE
jgi:hypothetical protein